MLFGTLLAKIEEAPPPLIDVDGTLFVQFGLFLVMYFVLSRLLFRPYLKMRAARSEGIDGARTAAQEMERKARAMLVEYDEKFGRARQRGGEERARLRAEAAQRERQLIGAAREESARALDEAKAKIGSDAAQARGELDTRARELAKEMAKKILGREVTA
jgi:F-type H+-transporting ATPase subunit b